MCETLGLPSRRHLLKSITSQDYDEWLAYRAETPPLPVILDIHLAQIAWLINRACGGNSTIDNWRLIHPPIKELTPEQLYQKAQLLVNACAAT